MEEHVTVSVRIKPTFNELIPNYCIKVINKHPAILLVVDKPLTLHFDNIYTEEIQQEDIYNDMVKPFVDKVRDGYNCTVFAYGQTGTGKSYTMGTSNDVKCDSDYGFVTRALRDFLESKADNQNEVEVSFIEIYNEKAYDLLTKNDKIHLSLKGFTLQNVTKLSVSDADEAFQLLNLGTSRRHIGETKQNAKSSRSHAIFTIHCSTCNGDERQTSKLNLVDLAGCESVKKTGNQGSSLHEGININKGLLSLGQVMTALSNNSSHIPYRQSVLTTVLKDSLNKQNFISLIACVSSKIGDFGETLQTLEFSNRVKRMRSKPEVNEFISQFKKDNPTLFDKNISRGPYETPLKRFKPNIQVKATPFVDSSNFDEAQLLSSSRTSTLSEAQQMSFSPLIRKYVQALKAELVTTLEDTIQRSIRKQGFDSNKENLPVRSLFQDVNNDGYEVEDQSPLIEEVNVVPEDNNDSFTMASSPKFKVPQVPINVRRSIRLQQKPSQVEKVEKTPRKSTRLEKSSIVRRRSVRLQGKKRFSDEAENSCVKCKAAAKVSPSKKRAKTVLDILNHGSQREIEKLQTVGAKTAEKILIFREIKGGFQSIGDLAEMPSWQKKKFERFLSDNFITNY